MQQIGTNCIWLANGWQMVGKPLYLRCSNLYYMATISYLLHSKNTNSPIYCRVTNGRAVYMKTKTGLFCDAANWSTKTKRAKSTSEAGKVLNKKLKNLSDYLSDALNDASAKGETLNSDWLKNQIDKHFDRAQPEAADLLTSAARQYIADLPHKVADNGKKVGATPATVAKYKNILKKIEAFEKHTGRTYHVKNVDSKFRAAFIEYLTSQKITSNTIGRYLKFVKTFVLDARKRGVEVSPQIKDFKGYTLKIPKVTLSFDELATLRDMRFTTDKLTIARDWFLIGCYTGQRVSDLLRMNRKMIKQMQGFEFIELEQVKTQKTVQIPIHAEVNAVLQRYNGNFPPLFSAKHSSNSVEFNEAIKTVCKQAGLTEPTEGSLRNPKSGIYEAGTFEKWQLITSHTCRRSFATNFYSLEKYPTPLLMNITAHATETQFLEYIGKKPLDYSLQLAKIWQDEQQQNQQHQLKAQAV